MPQLPDPSTQSGGGRARWQMCEPTDGRRETERTTDSGGQGLGPAHPVRLRACALGLLGRQGGRQR